jgi:hypothetical protein
MACGLAGILSYIGAVRLPTDPRRDLRDDVFLGVRAADESGPLRTDPYDS